ncbi:MAG TPA: isochorismatase family cysteine hydrolase [Bryobacteraceae bacterium]|jgi:nicotinamidase-related amidase
MASDYTSPVPARSALLTIDVQQDFTMPGAPAEIAGTHDRLPVMRRVLDAYRQLRLPIVHVVRLYLPDGTNADLCRRSSLESGRAVVHPDSAGAELADALKPVSDGRLDAALLLSGRLQTLAAQEWAMYKPRWDAFYGTPLEEHLHELGVNTIVVVGCNFPNCPRATVYGASARDFRVVLLADAVSGVYDQGLRELNGIGVRTPTSREYLDSLHP